MKTSTKLWIIAIMIVIIALGLQVMSAIENAQNIVMGIK